MSIGGPTRKISEAMKRRRPPRRNQEEDRRGPEKGVGEEMSDAAERIGRSDAFVALVTENYLKEPECLEECGRAVELGRPMYAVVWPGAVEGFERGGLARFPWRIVFKVSSEEDLEKAVKRIKDDIEAIGEN